MLNVCMCIDVQRQYLQERKVNCVNVAALNIAVGKVVCGAAVEGVPGQRRAQKVRSSILSFPVTLSIVSQARPASEVGLA